MSLIKIWKAKNKILEGVKNRIFKQEHIEQIFEERLKICNSCEEIDKEGGKCIVSSTRPCCGVCGCSLGLKLRSLSSECDLAKWKAITSQEEEDLINKLLDND